MVSADTAIAFGVQKEVTSMLEGHDMERQLLSSSTAKDAIRLAY